MLTHMRDHDLPDPFIRELQGRDDCLVSRNDLGGRGAGGGQGGGPPPPVEAGVLQVEVGAVSLVPQPEGRVDGLQHGQRRAHLHAWRLLKLNKRPTNKQTNKKTILMA